MRFVAELLKCLIKGDVSTEAPNFPPRLVLVDDTTRLMRGGIGPEADWHGRYESGR